VEFYHLSDLQVSTPLAINKLPRHLPRRFLFVLIANLKIRLRGIVSQELIALATYLSHTVLVSISSFGNFGCQMRCKYMKNYFMQKKNYFLFF